MASADHILPRSIVPELDHRLYNLRFMPQSLNSRMGNSTASWQVLLAREWYGKELLSEDGLRAVEKAATAR